MLKQNKNKNHNNVVMLAREKINSTEGTISKALTDNEISHKSFSAIINEERNFCKSKESIRMMKSQRDNMEKRNKSIEGGKRISIDEVIKQNGRTKSNVNYQV